MRWLWVLVLLFGVSVGLVGAQTPAEVLRGEGRKITIADLPESYRGVTFGSSDLGGLGMFGMWGGLPSSGSNEQTFELLSLIGTVLVDPDEFGQLVEGKRPRIRGYVLDLAEMMRLSPRGAGEESIPKPTFTETWIEGGRIIQWSPRPEVSREGLLRVFATPPKPAVSALRAQDLSNVKQVSLGIILYSSDYDDVYPNADSTAAAQNRVFPYTKNADIWKSKNPAGGRILFNTSLSRTSSTELANPAQTLLVWDENPWEDGGRNVGYADGHAKYLSAAEWASAWQSELERRRLRRASPPWVQPSTASVKKGKG